MCSPPRTPEMEKYLADHLKQYEGILKDLREHKELVGLERALNDPSDLRILERYIAELEAQHHVAMKNASVS